MDSTEPLEVMTPQEIRALLPAGYSSNSRAKSFTKIPRNLIDGVEVHSQFKNSNRSKSKRKPIPMRSAITRKHYKKHKKHRAKKTSKHSHKRKSCKCRHKKK